MNVVMAEFLQWFAADTVVRLFGCVLRLSLYGTIAGVGVLFAGFLMDRLQAPRWIVLVLWGLVGVRLLFPFSFSSSISLLGIANISGTIETSLDFNRLYMEETETMQASDFYEKHGDIQKNNGVQEAGREDFDTNNRAESVKKSRKTAEILLIFAAYIWGFGVAVLWGWAAFSYFRLKRRLRFAIKVTNLETTIYETDMLSSPCVVGILHPRIYLIPHLSKQQREHIVLHEQMHIQYLDYLWKIFSYLVVSMHWFNPFLWVMYGVFQGDLERCCDERVLARLGADKKEDYSESLLALAWERKSRLPSPIAFGAEEPKSRIKRILRYRKPVAFVSVLAVVLAAVIGSIFLTVPSVNHKAGTLTEGTVIREGISNLGIQTDTADITNAANMQNRGNKEESENIGESGTIGASGNKGESGNKEESENIEKSGNKGVSGNKGASKSIGGSENSEETESVGELGNSEETESVGELGNSENSEVYEEISDNNVIYQARKDGIYCVKNGEERQIYKGFAGVNTQMLLFEGCLYFLTDKTYTEGALDWVDNTIRWVNLSTLETGDLVLDIPVDMPIISEFWMADDGIIITQCIVPEGAYSTMLYHENEAVFNGKTIDKLSDAEAQRFGMATTQALLREPTLANVSHRVQGRNIAYIDMDGDQEAEKIVLQLAPHQLQIGEAYQDIDYYQMANTIWALNLNNTLLLAIYDDGPSADPYTWFFRYENGQIIEAGAMDIDIHNCKVNPNGTITAPFYKEIVQSDWITIYLELDENGFLHEVPQETYDFQKRNFVDLYRELPLHRKIEGKDTFMIPPQKVRFLKTSADWNWLLIETENGQQGWVHIVDYEVEELKENVMDVFAGVYLAG